MFVIKFCLLPLFVIELVMSAWVEIPQSEKKNYFVTPYTPYVYTPSLVFTSTTTDRYETMRPLSKPKVVNSELKKSITKMPDAFLQKTTTEIPFIDSTTRRSIIRHGYVNKINSTSSYVQQKRPSFYSSHENLKFPTTTPTSTISSDIPILSNKNFQVDQEDEFDEDDEYEQVYDDDEDNFPDDSDDIDDEGGEHDDDVDLDPSDVGEDNTDDGPMDEPLDGTDDEYYDDEEYEDDPPVNEPKGSTHQSQEHANANANGFSYANFMPYLQNIQSTLIRTSHTNNVDNKVSFLTDIKNRLLYAIQSRISTIWEPRSNRKTRSTRGDMWDSWEKGHSDHGMEFPSNEGALLTLGFLTFAVFLIKCILKLIHAIKGKHHDKGMTQIIIQNGTASPLLNTFRFKRDIDDIDIAKFMANLESYKPH